ncbi:MAG TPA: SpoIIE family protein phosphatase [Chthoniobacteraceae bacterium]|jgi:sigma-B regulation protein RsbU (phosphoserine phosphatase)|nr:SpoIIE family protein phosphatase [Chthoniobacteraceae bacterium]
MRIIVVDDDDMSRRLLTRSLDHQHQVIECRNGFEAAQLLESGGPALVVLDYEMPEINGAEVCELIRGSSDPEVAQTPIIMVTGHSNANHEVECLRSGANDFVTKPVNMAVLQARIDTHTRLHSLRRQLLAQNGELEKWRSRHEEDLEAARLTQQAILPARLPSLAGWNFGAHYHPLIQIGGDMYDWVKEPDGTLLVWMTDATGHGASAALLTTLSKLLFRHAAAETQGAAALMDRVEREFQAVFKGHFYMTAACLVLAPQRGRVTFCGAGQPPLLVARRSGQVESIPSSRPPLGLNKTASAEEHFEIRQGEAILLYTDGLYEVQNPRGERLGHEALMRMLPQTGGCSAAEWLAAVIGKAAAYADSVSYPDDIAAFAAIYE